MLASTLHRVGEVVLASSAYSMSSFCEAIGCVEGLSALFECESSLLRVDGIGEFRGEFRGLFIILFATILSALETFNSMSVGSSGRGGMLLSLNWLRGLYA